MKLRLPYIINIIFLVLIFISVAQAQEDTEDTEDAKEMEVTDSLSLDENAPVINMPVFSSVGILLDYGKLAGLVLNTETKYEGGVQLEFKNVIVVIGEYGIGEITPKTSYQNANYLSSGSYYRIGIGYKRVMNKKNNLLFSMRYGKSNFRDEANIQVRSPSGIYDDTTIPFSRNNLSATWYEVVLSSESRIWKGLYAGFHIRFRMLDKYQEQTPIDTYSIPGYGRTFDSTVPALNLYVKYAFERF